MEQKFLAELFDPFPRPWGLRGDPGLWQELKQKFKDVPMPATKKELNSLIRKAYKESMGQPMSNPKWKNIERFDKGGMSHGTVDPQWWNESGLPLLKKRWIELMAPEMMKKMSSFYYFKTEGIERVKEIYPDYVSFVEANKEQSYEDVKAQLLLNYQ